MNEQERKDQLASMTGGLKCRCPGFQVMTRVDCKGFDGVQYCYYACEDPRQPGVEFRHPVGEGNSCRCGLGTKLDPASIRFVEEGDTTFGFARCVKLETSLEGPEKSSPLLLWPIAIAIGGLFWFATTGGGK